MSGTAATLESYLEGRFETTEGWCQPLACRMAAEAAAVQHDLGIGGGVAEIGVYRGKFLMALACLSDGPVTAIDLFGQQASNVDRSGSGADRQRFLDNWHGLFGDRDVGTLAIDSMHLKGEVLDDLVRRAGPVALFSVDGGHTALHVLNDLHIAERMLAPGGLVFLDDYLNPDWPGVIEGLFRYLYLGAPRLLPLCSGFGKLVLVDHAWQERMFPLLESRAAAFTYKKVSLYGTPTLALRPGPSPA